MVTRCHKRHLADGHRQALATHLGINGRVQHRVLHINITHGYRLADVGPETTGCHHSDVLSRFAIQLRPLTHRCAPLTQQADTFPLVLLAVDLVQNHPRPGEAPRTLATVAPRLAARPDQTRLYRRGFSMNIITVET